MVDTCNQLSDEEIQANLPEWDTPIEADAATPNTLSEAAIDFLCQVGTPIPTAPAQEDKTALIGPCGGCQRELPWPTPRPGSWASPVSCPQCKRWYYIEGRNERKPVVNDLLASEITHVKERLRALLTLRQRESASLLFKQLVGDAYLEAEHRRTTRVEVSRQVVAIPLDIDAVPIGKAEAQTLINISQAGACLLGTTGTKSPLVLIDLSGSVSPGLQLLACVDWRQSKEGFTRLGCEFLHQPDERMPLE